MTPSKANKQLQGFNMKTEFQANQALAANRNSQCAIAKAYAQKEGVKQAKAMQQRLASLSFAERLKTMF